MSQLVKPVINILEANGLAEIFKNQLTLHSERETILKKYKRLC